jgi:hypothetical protein
VLDIVAFIIFSGMAYRIVVAVRRESAIFAEFKQSTALAYTALLFPLGPVVMLLIGIRAPLIGISVCAACYIPSLVLARRLAVGFDRAGTDRIKGASAAAWEAFGTAIAGLAYAAIVLVFIVGLGFLRGPTDA